MEKIGEARLIDEAMSVVYELLSLKPESFPIIPGTTRLRIAKTRAYEREGNSVPPLRIFFTIEKTDDRRSVILKYIETIEHEFDS